MPTYSAPLQSPVPVFFLSPPLHHIQPHNLPDGAGGLVTIQHRTMEEILYSYCGSHDKLDGVGPIDNKPSTD